MSADNKIWSVKLTNVDSLVTIQNVTLQFKMVVCVFILALLTIL